MSQRMRTRSSYHKLTALDAAAQLNQILSDPAIRPPLDLIGTSEEGQAIAEISLTLPEAAATMEAMPLAASVPDAPPPPQPALKTVSPPAYATSIVGYPSSGEPVLKSASAPSGKGANVPVSESGSVAKLDAAPKITAVQNFNTAPNFDTVLSFVTVSCVGAVPNSNTVPDFATDSNLSIASDSTKVSDADAVPTRTIPNSDAVSDSATASDSDAVPNFAIVSAPNSVEALPEHKLEIGDAAAAPSGPAILTGRDETRAAGAFPKEILIRPANRVQDAEINREKTIYAHMWEKGAVETKYDDGSPRTKVMQAGVRTLAASANVPQSTCQEAVAGLIYKLSIQQIEPGLPALRVGARYRIYSFREILRRRQIAGLNYYAKLPGGGRIFVTEDGHEIDLAARYELLTKTIPNFGEDADPNFGIAQPNSGTESVPNFALQLESKSLENNTKPTSSELDIARITDAFLQHYEATDQLLIESTVAQVLRRVPDVGTDELVHAIQLKGAETKAGMAVAKQPGAYLRSVVVRYFAGSAFQARRLRAKAQQKQAILQSARETAVEAIREEIDSQANIWQKVRELIAAKMDSHSFGIWIHPMRLLRISGEFMYLVIPVPEFRHAVAKYEGLIVSAANEAQLSITTARLVTVEEAASMVTACSPATVLQ